MKLIVKPQIIIVYLKRYIVSEFPDGFFTFPPIKENIFSRKTPSEVSWEVKNGFFHNLFWIWSVSLNVCRLA